MILIISICCLVACNNSSKQVDSGLCFEKISGKDEYAVIGLCDKTVSRIIIPSTYNGLPVTKIADTVFYENTTVSYVFMPDSITQIGLSEFYGCSNLQTVVLSQKLTEIPKYAFYYCTKLINITIPESVTKIGQSAFNGCNSLESISIGNGVKSIDKKAFYYCDKLSSVTIGSSVTSIDNSAFKDCVSLTSITFSDTAGWYMINDYESWQNKTGGTQIDVSSPTNNINYNGFLYKL